MKAHPPQPTTLGSMKLIPVKWQDSSPCDNASADTSAVLAQPRKRAKVVDEAGKTVGYITDVLMAQYHKWSPGTGADQPLALTPGADTSQAIYYRVNLGDYRRDGKTFTRTHDACWVRAGVMEVLKMHAGRPIVDHEAVWVGFTAPGGVVLSIESEVRPPNNPFL
jgi:hypothetical protein